MINKILLFTFILACGAAFATAQTSDKDYASLKTLTEKLLNAQTTYDAKALDSILTQDYVEISPVGEIDPRAKVLGFYTPEAKERAANVSVKTSVNIESTRVFGKVSIVIATFNYEMASNGKAMPPRSIRTTLVCRKDGGEWKIASAQFTRIRISPAPSK